MTDPGQSAAQLPLGGDALEVRRVTGHDADGWLLDPFRMSAVARRPVLSVEIEGYVPYERDGGVLFVAWANGNRHEIRVERSGPFSWEIPCRVPAGRTLELEIAPLTAHSPAEHGSPDVRKLSFVLARLTALDSAGALPAPPLADAVRICPDPVFIVGSPRSGTSVLALALAEHGAFCTLPETVLPLAFLGGDRIRAMFDVATADESHWLRQIGATQPEFDRWAALAMNALITSRAGGRRWIEQSPSTTSVAGVLAAALPGARFLHVVRDGREAVHSMVHSGFSQPFAAQFPEACRQWRNHVHAGLRLKEEFPERVLEVSHRRLSAAPEEEFARIAAFLEERDEPGPARLARGAPVNSSFIDDAGRAAAWTGWSDDARRTFVRIAGAMMDRIAVTGLVDPDWRHAVAATETEAAAGGASVDGAMTRARTATQRGWPSGLVRSSSTDQATDAGLAEEPASANHDSVAPPGRAPESAAPADLPESGTPVLSTVLLSWNRPELLRRSLESLLATVTVPHELIVVDNGSGEETRSFIAECCDGRADRHAILLDANLGGEALDLGIARARGEFVHVSENDIECLPGWDLAALAAFDAFPDLGQLSLLPAEDAASSPRVERGEAIRVTEGGVAATSVVRRRLFEAGLRWRSRGSGVHRPPANEHFSGEVRELGFLVASTDAGLVRHVGLDPEEIAGRLDYYLDASIQKSGNLDWLWKTLAAHGYLLVDDGAGWQALKRRRRSDPRPGKARDRRLAAMTA